LLVIVPCFDVVAEIWGVYDPMELPTINHTCNTDAEYKKRETHDVKAYVRVLPVATATIDFPLTATTCLSEEFLPSNDHVNALPLPSTAAACVGPKLK
jgi:hypothetical protein